MEKPTIVIAVALLSLAVLLLIWAALTPFKDKAPTPTITADAPVRPPQTEPTPYQRLGHHVLLAAVDQFYGRVVADERLRHYFAHMDGRGMAELRRHQAAMIGQILGGPVRYELGQLHTAHQDLRISRDAYWLAVAHLAAVLTGLSVDRDIVVHLLTALYDVESYIVDEASNRSSASAPPA